MAEQTRKRKNNSAEDESTEQLLTWVVVGTSITLADRRVFENGKTFKAPESAIRKSFRDLVELVTPVEQIKKIEKQEPKYFLQEVVPTAEELEESGYVTKYNIVDVNDKVVSEKPLEKDVAVEQLKALNA